MASDVPPNMASLMAHIVPGEQSAPPPMATVDRTRSGKLTELMAQGMRGAALDDGIKEAFGAKEETQWLPMRDGLAVYKHILNEHEFLGTIEGLKKDWLAYGYNPDESSVVKISRHAFGWVVYCGWKRCRRGCAGSSEAAPGPRSSSTARTAVSA